jgi:hypothetical protein
MLRLTRLLFQSNPESRYLDYSERALYNHILSSQHPTKGGFVYFTPMRPRHYRVYSQPQECFWCCVGSGMENHGKYGEFIYSHDDDGIFVNLFIPSVLEWKEKGVTLAQSTKFPDEESSQLMLTLDAPRKFGLSIRRPGWIGSAGMSIQVNGKAVESLPASGAYVTIEREWKSGDTVTFSLPITVHLEYLPDKSAWASILYGPIVLAAATDSDQLLGLWANGGRWAHRASGPFYPLDAAPAILSKTRDFSSAIKPVHGKSLTFTISNVVDPEKYKVISQIIALLEWFTGTPGAFCFSRNHECRTIHAFGLIASLSCRFHPVKNRIACPAGSRKMIPGHTAVHGEQGVGGFRVYVESNGAERSSLIRRSPPRFPHTCRDPANLLRVANNGNHRHAAAAVRTGPDVHFVYPGGRLRTMKARLASSRAQALLRSVRPTSGSWDTHAGPPSRASPCPYQPSGARLLRAGRFFQVPRAREAYNP